MRQYLQGLSNTSSPQQQTVHSYQLRGVNVVRPNQVWSSDITYIRLRQGFVYLVAVVDWYSRKVLAWRLSNTMACTFCANYLEQSLQDTVSPTCLTPTWQSIYQ